MIKIIDKNDVKENNEIDGNICVIKKDDVKKDIIEKKNKINFIAKDRMMMCERSSKLGLANNCVLCQSQNSIIFEKCGNKWK